MFWADQQRADQQQAAPPGKGGVNTAGPISYRNQQPAWPQGRSLEADGGQAQHPAGTASRESAWAQQSKPPPARKPNPRQHRASETMLGPGQTPREDSEEAPGGPSKGLPLAPQYPPQKAGPLVLRRPEARFPQASGLGPGPQALGV